MNLAFSQGTAHPNRFFALLGIPHESGQLKKMDVAGNVLAPSAVLVAERNLAMVPPASLDLSHQGVGRCGVAYRWPQVVWGHFRLIRKLNFR